MITLDYPRKKSLETIKQTIAEKKEKLAAIKRGSELGLYIHSDNFDGLIRLLEDYSSRIDLVYIDPPFNTKSSFYYDGSQTATISSSRQSLVAYEDSMPFEDYLEFLRERLILIHLLLSEQGTLYLHIDLKVGHYVKLILDEIFGNENFLNDVARVKSNPKNFARRAYGNERDMVLVYAKNKRKNIFNQVTVKFSEQEMVKRFSKIDENGRRYTTVPCHAPGETQSGLTGQAWRGMLPPKGRHWRCAPEELERLDRLGYIEWSKTNNPRIKKYADEHDGKKIQDVWLDYKDPQRPLYPTEKNAEMLEMIVQQSSHRQSIIMDCFCGSGSFLKAGLKHDRYVIGIDQSDSSKLVVSNRNLGLKTVSGHD